MDDQDKKCCETCRYGVTLDIGALPSYVGCHRFPPAAESDSPLEHYGASKFPLVALNAFCWEWSAKVEGEELPQESFLTDP